MSHIFELPTDRWTPEAPTAGAAEALETGDVLLARSLPFALTDEERTFLNPSVTRRDRKSVYLRPGRPGVHGTSLEGVERERMQRLLERYRDQSLGLISALFPRYREAVRPATTSFRPRPTGSDQALSWRKDDTRLHVDAFPSNPTHGMRILRVFTNVGSEPRHWRVGDEFESMAVHFARQIPPYRHWLAALQSRLGITKSMRSPYDHAMLHLHDLAKADLHYQKHAPQQDVHFPPGSTWICFSDQVMHAAMAGQYLFEQTLHLPPSALAFPERAPSAVVHRLLYS